jgi:hypothetical protein
MAIFGFALIGVQGNSLDQRRFSTKFDSLTKFSHDLPLAIGYERAYSCLLLETGIPRFQELLSVTRNMTDALFDKYTNEVHSLLSVSFDDEATMQSLRGLLRLPDQLRKLRRQFDNRANVTSVSIVKQYQGIVSPIYGVMLPICFHLGDQRLCVLHNTISRRAEEFGTMIAIGSVILTRGNSTVELNGLFYSFYQREQQLRELIATLAPQSQQPVVNRTEGNDVERRATMMQNALASYAIGEVPFLPNVTTDYYVNQTITMLLGIFATADSIEESLNQASNALLVSSIVFIVVVCAFVIICFGISCLCTLGFSRTITGPWQRLNSIMEKTINLFVPRDVLAIIKVPRIIDLKYGLVVQKELTLLRSEIDNVTIFAKMKPSERYAFLNAFLNSIGPIIRKHDGFIDKYLSEGFVAVFRHSRDGLRAAVELHKYVDVFNKTFPEYPNIKLASAVCSGECMIGTVGETKRMDISIQSDIG